MFARTVEANPQSQRLEEKGHPLFRHARSSINLWGSSTHHEFKFTQSSLIRGATGEQLQLVVGVSAWHVCAGLKRGLVYTHVICVLLMLTSVIWRLHVGEVCTLIGVLMTFNKTLQQ